MKTSIKNIDCIKVSKKEKYNEFGYIWEFTFAVDGELFKLLDESNYNYDELKFLEKDLEWELQMVGDKRCIFFTEFFDKDGGLEDEDAEELHTWRDTLDICAEDLFNCIKEWFSAGEYFIVKFEDEIPYGSNEYGLRDEFEDENYDFKDVDEMDVEDARKIIKEIIDDCTVEFTSFSNNDSDCYITGTYNTLDDFENEFKWEDNQGFLQNQFPKNPFDQEKEQGKYKDWKHLRQDLENDDMLTQILTDFCHNQDYEFERNGYTLRIN